MCIDKKAFHKLDLRTHTGTSRRQQGMNMKNNVKLGTGLYAAVIVLSILTGCVSSRQPAERFPDKAGSFTLMILMNGSDLESENGFATDDLHELMACGFNPDKLKVFVLTCGTTQWQNDRVPADVPVIWRLYGSGLEELSRYPEPISVGNPQLLSSFVNFCYETAPASRYGLIFWNHGGGPVLGFGSDQHFDDEALPLPALALALNDTPAARAPLAFIGFDACLMGSIETALLLSDYAEYMIASEELEPGSGWDYRVFKTLSDKPALPISRFGKKLVDSFIRGNAPSEDIPTGDSATLSVVDLRKIKKLADAVDDAARSLLPVTENTYPALARARYQSFGFGKGGPQESDADLIDIERFAQQLAEITPQYTQAIGAALNETVAYANATDNLKSQAAGLSVYFPFSGKEYVSEYLEIYRSLGVLPHYTAFIEAFAGVLTGEPLHAVEFFFRQDEDLRIGIEPQALDYITQLDFELWQQMEESDVPDTYWYVQLAQLPATSVDEDGIIEEPFTGTWITFEDRVVCLYSLDETDAETRYAIPALLDEEEVMIIAAYNKRFPEGIVVGAVPVDQDPFAMPAREMLPLRSGDTIQLLYRAILMPEDDRELTQEELESEQWYESEPFTVTGKPLLGTAQAEDGTYRYCFTATDLQQNTYYSDFIALTLD